MPDGDACTMASCGMCGRCTRGRWNYYPSLMHRNWHLFLPRVNAVCGHCGYPFWRDRGDTRTICDRCKGRTP